jgi:hypothetical protein
VRIPNTFQTRLLLFFSVDLPAQERDGADAEAEDDGGGARGVHAGARGLDARHVVDVRQHLQRHDVQRLVRPSAAHPPPRLPPSHLASHAPGERGGFRARVRTEVVHVVAAVVVAL